MDKFQDFGFVDTSQGGALSNDEAEDLAIKFAEKINEIIDQQEKIEKAILYLAAICKYEFGRHSEIERKVNSILKE
jgi:hypothetical protein